MREDVPVGHPNFGKALPCPHRLAEMEAERIRALRAMSNLEALARMTFDTFIPERDGLSLEKRRNLRLAYEQVKEFAENPQGWLLIRGSYGCGKTHLAAAVANYRIERGQPALFVAVPDLLDYLRATFAPTSEVTYSERFEMIRTTPLLILDDLGTENMTEWVQEKLFQIFNYRYNARLPTVITTNRDLEEIDLRLRSRMLDASLTRIVVITAPDFRYISLDPSQSELSSLSLHDNQTFATFSLRQHELLREEADNLKRALDLAKRFAQDPLRGLAEDPNDPQPPVWLVLTGTYGCGKTHLAAAIANYRQQQGHPVLFITVPDLLDHLRRAYSPQSLVPYDKRFEEVRTAPLLILDDLGTESATPWAREKLYQIINYRYAARLPTVITTAVPVEELDPRLSTRILDDTRCRVFGILAPAYRGRAAARRQQPGTRPRNLGR